MPVVGGDVEFRFIAGTRLRSARNIEMKVEPQGAFVTVTWVCLDINVACSLEVEVSSEGQLVIVTDEIVTFDLSRWSIATFWSVFALLHLHNSDSERFKFANLVQTLWRRRGAPSHFMTSTERNIFGIFLIRILPEQRHPTCLLLRLESLTSHTYFGMRWSSRR
jgi:hypothetical protein